MADEPTGATENTAAPAAPAETAPAAVPAAPAEAVADFTGQSDEQVAEAAEAAAAEANEIVSSDEEFTEERDVQFASAMARAKAASAELTARADRRERHAARRAEAAAFQVERPTAAPSPVVPRVAEITNRPANPAVPARPQAPAFRLVVPTDSHNLVNDRPQGSEFASLDEVGVAFEQRLQSYGASGAGRSVSHGLAMIRRDYGPELTVQGKDSDDTAISFARRESNLAGGNVVKAWSQKVEETGSLTAAAGWCAPSETLYTLCEMETTAGLLELPEVVATRGGIRYTSDIAFPDLMAASAYTNLTEAQVIAGTPQKNCAPVPCPTFVDSRLGVSVTCLTGSFLQLRGYPELVARYVRGALVAHEHKENAAKIAAIVAQAGAVTNIATPATDAATSSILKAVEVAATDIRYRYALARNASLEVVLPEWIIPVLRDDFTRRPFPGDPAVTDPQIMQWFAVRNIRPQFVRDWQDFYGGAGITFPGGVPATNPPYNTEIVPDGTTVQFLIYPAGSVVMAVQDVISLRNVYDATNLKQNLYTELFTEDGWAPIFPCQGLRLYSAQTCRSGATGLGADWSCAAP